jgi:hypothetical protein
MAFDLEAMLRALREVEFILVGGVAAAVHGSPIVTLETSTFSIESSRQTWADSKLLWTPSRQWRGTILVGYRFRSVISRAKAANWR